jgi:hypothetical protein
MQVYSIQEGNAALSRKLAAAAKLQALHLGTAVQAVQRDATTGQYSLTAVQPATHKSSADRDSVSNTGDGSAAQMGATSHQFNIDHIRQSEPLADVSDSPAVFGPFDGVVLATPLEGSDIELQGVLPAGSALPKREYQSTVTTYVTGVLNPSYFKVKMPHVICRL